MCLPGQQFLVKSNQPWEKAKRGFSIAVYPAASLRGTPPEFHVKMEIRNGSSVFPGFFSTNERMKTITKKDTRADTGTQPHPESSCQSLLLFQNILIFAIERIREITSSFSFYSDWLFDFCPTCWSVGLSVLRSCARSFSVCFVGWLIYLSFSWGGGRLSELPGLDRAVGFGRDQPMEKTGRHQRSTRKKKK